ncbi:MAG TPA: nitroreductase family deazaflavin-dependent oxidoreductase [Acidimicrobiales bacterium]|nr:nitroreductase family deazaflavin-dependent oxidoreductase [Acidimicrobiales bacterium]
MNAEEYAPSPWDWVRNQVEEYEATGGDASNKLMNTDYPIVVVHTKGAKTGLLRKTPLMRVEHNGEYALIASLGGAPKHPVWYFNLLAHPDDVLVQDGPEPFPVTIRELDGAERAAWWERGVAAYPPYAEYQQRTERVIPLFLASPKRSTPTG